MLRTSWLEVVIRLLLIAVAGSKIQPPTRNCRLAFLSLSPLSLKERIPRTFPWYKIPLTFEIEFLLLTDALSFILNRLR
jgi:hypothetical protein